MGVEFFKTTWFTSDWHVGHEAVLDFCKGSRPFEDLEEMHRTLIARYNSQVKDTHSCYFLGDFAFKGVKYGKEVLDQLNGKKVIILGNHDKGHQSLLNMGFDIVMDYASWKVHGLHITASHFPLKGIKREQCEHYRNYQQGEGWHKEFVYDEKYLLPEDVGQDIHLHGHIHSPNKGFSKKVLDKQYDVGVDANNLMPVSLNHIVKEINKCKSK